MYKDIIYYYLVLFLKTTFTLPSSVNDLRVQIMWGKVQTQAQTTHGNGELENKS